MNGSVEEADYSDSPPAEEISNSDPEEAAKCLVKSDSPHRVTKGNPFSKYHVSQTE